MIKKVKVISALTFLITQTGLAPSALAHEAQLAEEQCEALLGASDKAALRRKLEFLLEEEPNHPCVPMIVGLLGGAPLASASNNTTSNSDLSNDEHSDDEDRRSGGTGAASTSALY